MNLQKISNKTMTRIAAVQTLYQYKLEDSVKSIDLIIEQMISLYQGEEIKNDISVNIYKPIKVKLSVSYFETLVRSVIQNLVQIDEIISKHLTSKWKITNLPILLLALLRVAICELQFFPNVPTKVVINEFTNITNAMLSEHEVGFVNSILDTIARKDKAALCYPVH